MVNKDLCVVDSLSIAMLRCAVNATTGSPTSKETDAASCNAEPFATGKKYRFFGFHEQTIN